MLERQISEQVITMTDGIDFKHLADMWELIPGVLFWIKDTQGKILHCNQVFVEHVGKRRYADVVNKTDNDLSPPHIAKQFVVDDQKVINGEEVNNRLELNVMKNGEMAWFNTSKRALRNNQGDIIGTYGISSHLENSYTEPAGMGSLQKPVDYIRNHYSEDISIKALAEHCHISVSALERRFKKYLCKTPLQFLKDVRLEHARKLLIETDEPIAHIATNCGFTEHSYFSSQFSKFFNELPSDVRKNHRAQTTHED